MWRIFGHVFFNDKDYFVDIPHKRFNKPLLEDFLSEKGVAIYDAATVVNRLQNNASDKFLEIVEATDIASLLHQIPHCHAIVATGQKATDVLCKFFNVDEPKVGHFVSITFENRLMRLYRMPSSSRAYPLRLEEKAVCYRRMLEQEGVIR